MKKLFALALVLVMVLSMMPTAFAAGEDYQYEIYQIFTGDFDSNVLTNVKWGKNGIGYVEGADEQADVPEDILTELEEIDAGASYNEKLEVITKYAKIGLTDIPFKTKDTSDTEFSIEVPDGYYLVKDVPHSQNDYGETYTTYIVKVVDGLLTVNRKADTIVPDKKIVGSSYNDTLDVDDDIVDGETNNVGIGSIVTFELSVKLPANADDYSYYYCVLNDTLSEGLTFLPSTVEVTAVLGSDTEKLNPVVKEGDKVISGDYFLYDLGNNSFQVAMRDAASLAGKTIKVTYNAEVNEKAIVGVKGNPNLFDVVYSNDPNYKYDDVNDNGRPDVDEKTPIGRTPTFETRTYETGIKLEKVDEHLKALEGAEFTISGDSIKYILSSQDKFEVAADGTYYRLHNGTGEADDTYTLEAPQMEDTYKKAADGATAGYVNMGTAETPDWVEYNETLHAGKEIYVKVLSNKHLYELDPSGDPVKYKKDTTFHVRGDDAGENFTVEVGGDGILEIRGLGEGVYTISETKVPAGYNKIDDITLTIDWKAPAAPIVGNEKSWECEWSAHAVVEGSGTDLTLNEDGIFELRVINRSGSNLPETGGMGTTLFYAVGGIMVLAAIVLLITKKRMSVA